MRRMPLAFAFAVAVGSAVAAQSDAPPAGQVLLERHQCNLCHGELAMGSVGPRYADIAAAYRSRYRNPDEARRALAAVIVEGHDRKGTAAMAPHANVARDDALRMAAFLLESK